MKYACDLFDKIKFFKEHYKELYQMMRNSDQSYNTEWHIEGDVWTHTMMVCSHFRLGTEKYPLQSKELELLQWAALLHDVGKPEALSFKEIKDGPLTGEMKVIFYGHGGVSCKYVYDVMKKFSEMYSVEYTNSDYITVLELVARHQDPYQLEKTFLDNNSGVSREMLLALCDADAIGGIGKVLRKNTLESIVEVDLEDVSDTTNTLTILIGPPGCGKSTFSKKHFNNYTVISRDKIMLEYAYNKQYIFSTTDAEYSNAWKQLTEEDQKNIDSSLHLEFQEAIKNKENILIDMTNMSKKSRAKWINPAKQKKYSIKYVVFIPEHSKYANKLMERKNNGKDISNTVVNNMWKNFTYPVPDEYHTLEFVLGYE